MASQELSLLQQPAESQARNITVLESPLFKASTEVRFLIYGFTLTTKSTIKFRLTERKSRDDHFTFKHCNETLSGTELCKATHPIGKPCLGCQPLDTGLLLTCRLVYKEALQYLFRTNRVDIHMTDMFRNGLAMFSDHFLPFLKDIRRLRLHSVYLRAEGLDSLKLYRMRQFGIDFRGLTSLEIYGDVVLPHDCRSHVDDYIKTETERLLNWFRPMSLLPLQQANVHISDSPIDFGLTSMTADACIVGELERRAVAILLKDPTDPEEGQVDAPMERVKEMQQKEEAQANSRWDFRESLVVGKVDTTMSSPLSILTARLQEKGTRRRSL